MAKLNPSIIYSLTTDLRELHEIGRDMVKQIEANKIISWRYPDRESKDINIVVETELFDSGDYVLLLELIIDRLYFILSMALHRLSTLPELSYDCNLPKNVSKPIGISFGTLVSFLWKRIQCLNTKTNKGSETNNTVTQYQIRKSSTDTKNICENCTSSYTILKNVIKFVEECMLELNFQSKCKECRENCEKNIINLSQENVMEQWSDSLSLDIRHILNYTIQKTLENTKILKEINNLKNGIDITNKKSDSTEKKNLELEMSITEMKIMAKTVVLENEKMSRDYDEIKKKLDDMTQKCCEKEIKLNEIENKIHDVIKKREESIEIIKSEFCNQINILSAERDFCKQLYMEYKSKLDEFQQNSDKNQENNITLKDRIEKFEVCEKELQEANSKLHNEYNALQQSFEILKTQEERNMIRIITLEEEKIKLKNDLKEYDRREMLLLRCPDLNGPITSVDSNGKNPLEDMKQQFLANETRVNLLQDQNEKLKRVINKMQYLSKLTS